MNWMPGAEIKAFPDAGLFIPGAPMRGVLHTTEGNNVEGAMAAYAANNSAPHFTISAVRIVQHISIDRAARSLKNLRGGVETGRFGAIQIEVVGFASKPDWSQATKRNVRKVLDWITENTSIRPESRVVFPPYPRRIGAPSHRLSNRDWLACDFWVGHVHVPENTHGDPGAIDVEGLFIKPRTGERFVTSFTIQDIVSTLPCPTGGAWILTRDGAIYAVGGASYLGGANGKPYFRGRFAVMLLPLNGGGYTIRADTGELYSYPLDGSAR